MRLQQFYLSRHGRFRLIERDGREPERLFTFKHPTRKGLLLEIETPVSEADYDMAREDAEEVLTKLRFDIDEGEGHWSVDFLTDGIGGDVYFAMAEVEFPVGGTYVMPAFMVPHVDIVVPHAENASFANARLIGPAQAERAVKEYRERRVAEGLRTLVRGPTGR